MKRLDRSETGIFDIRWSPDDKWISYVNDREIRLVEVASGELRLIGPGNHPNITADGSVVFERDNEIRLASKTGEKILVGLNDVSKNTPKRYPAISPDGKRLAFAACDVFDKESQSLNSYPHRHFVCVAAGDGRRPVSTRQQWYGGTFTWFPDSSALLHYEFDSTGGPRIHLLRSDGEPLTTFSGLYPSISPDGTRVAARPKTGGSLVIYNSKDGAWSAGSTEMSALRIPVDEVQHPSANPPVWLDNLLVLIDEDARVWRIDTKRDKAEELKKHPRPVLRRQPTMTASNDRSYLAMEFETDDGFDLGVLPLA